MAVPLGAGRCLMIRILILNPLILGEPSFVSLARLHVRLYPLNSPDKVLPDRESVPKVHMSVFRRVPTLNDIVSRIDRIQVISNNGDLFINSLCHLNAKGYTRDTKSHTREGIETAMRTMEKSCLSPA